MIESYDIGMERPERPEECYGCSFKTTQLIRYGQHREEKNWLCLPCAATSASNAERHPRHYEGQSALLFSMSMLANMILDAIITGKDPRSEHHEEEAQFTARWSRKGDSIFKVVARREGYSEDYLPDSVTLKDAVKICKSYELEADLGDGIYVIAEDGTVKEEDDE